MITLVFAALLLTTARVGAESPGHATEPTSSWVLGAKAVQLTAFEPGHDGERHETITAVGGGVFAERTIVPGIDLELSVVAATDHRRTLLPIDLLLKASWEPSPRWTTYLGAGPTVSLDVEAHGTHAHGGGSIVGGTYFWCTDDVGLDLEVDYALLAEHGVAQELQVAVGPIVRF